MSPSPSSSAGPGYGLGPAATPRCQQPARNAEGGAAPPPPPASPPPACAAAALRERGDPARPTGSAAAAMAGEVKTKLSKNLLRMKVRWGAGSGRPEELSAGTGGKGRPGRAGPGLAAGPLGADGAVLAARSRRAAAVLPRWGLRLCRHLGAPRWGRGISTSYISAQGCCSGTASVFCVLCAMLMLLHTYKHVCLVLSFRLGLQLSELLCSNFTSKGLLR